MLRAVLLLPARSATNENKTAQEVADALRSVLPPRVRVQVIDARTVHATDPTLDTDDEDADAFTDLCTPVEGDWYLDDVFTVEDGD